jgi:nicastrin
VNAQTCLRRGGCLPIGGLSNWGTFSYNFSKSDQKNVILVSAIQDSTSLFLSNSWGAGTTATGLVTLLAVANSLMNMVNLNRDIPKSNHYAISFKSMQTLGKTVIFAGFHGEQYGFAGSSRFVQDLTTPFSCSSKIADATAGCPISNADCSQPCFPSVKFSEIDFQVFFSCSQWY